MTIPFLSSEEYDEHAHKLYDEGAYDRAIDTLKEGLARYPTAVDLHVGLGYTRLAREEFAWARAAFERALAIEPDHEDARAGLGEVLLRFGKHIEALDLFDQVRRDGQADDLELTLAMGRALYREGLFEAARDFFAEAMQTHETSIDAIAAHAYALHRLGRETACIQELRRVIALDPSHIEARVYLGHLYYGRGDSRAALDEFEAVLPAEHWDRLAVWRVLELKRILEGAGPDDPRVALWEQRLDEMEAEIDPVDTILVEIGRRVEAEDPTEGTNLHHVRTPEGETVSGAWSDIVWQLREMRGLPGESIAQFMHRYAEECHERLGIRVSSDDPESFLRTTAHAGLWRIVN